MHQIGQLAYKGLRCDGSIVFFPPLNGSMKPINDVNMKPIDDVNMLYNDTHITPQLSLSYNHNE